jgi:outer membrane biosynthesis protein TonB
MPFSSPSRATEAASSRRALVSVVLASLGFHALLLWAFAGTASPPQTAPERTMEVRLSALAKPLAPKPRVSVAPRKTIKPVAKQAPKRVVRQPKLPEPREIRVVRAPESTPEPVATPKPVPTPSATEPPPPTRRTTRIISKTTTQRPVPEEKPQPQDAKAPEVAPTSVAPLPTVAPKTSVASTSPETGGGTSGGGTSGGGTSGGGTTGGGTTGGGTTGGGTTGGVTSGGVTSGGVTSGGVTSGGVTSGGVTSGGVTSGGVTSGGVTSGGVTSGGVTSGGVTSGGVTSGDVMGGGGPFGLRGPKAGEGPRRIVYVLDISNSMETRIGHAERELRKALSGLQAAESFSIVTFWRKKDEFSKRLVPATTQNIAKANRWLDKQRLSGGTNLERALTTALSIKGVNVVVVITDGVPNYGIGAPEESKTPPTPQEVAANFDKLARRVRQLNVSGARIDTVGLVGKNPDGSDDSFEATRLLQQIARENGGESKLVSSGESLDGSPQSSPQP